MLPRLSVYLCVYPYTLSLSNICSMFAHRTHAYTMYHAYTYVGISLTDLCVIIFVNANTWRWQHFWYYYTSQGLCSSRSVSMSIPSHSNIFRELPGENTFQFTKWSTTNHEIRLCTLYIIVLICASHLSVNALHHMGFPHVHESFYMVEIWIEIVFHFLEMN